MCCAWQWPFSSKSTLKIVSFPNFIFWKGLQYPRNKFESLWCRMHSLGQWLWITLSVPDGHKCLSQLFVFSCLFVFSFFFISVCAVCFCMCMHTSLRAAPLTLHSVLTIRCALASDRKGLESVTAFLPTPYTPLKFIANQFLSPASCLSVRQLKCSLWEVGRINRLEC